MLYGHVETLAERVDHLLRLREQQDRSGGFLTFVPLAYQVATTKLVPRQTPPTDSLRTIAAARLLLDNFPHIEAYWVIARRGDRVGRAALRRRRRQRHAGGRAASSTCPARDARRPGARAALPDDPRRRQDPRGARRALQRRPGLELTCSTQIRDKALDGKRLDRDDGRWLLAEAPLLELGALAHEVRFRRDPRTRVTFVIDSNPNYTNVCITDCQFCAFYRKPGDPEACTLTRRRGDGEGGVRRSERAPRPCCSRAGTTRRCRSTTTSRSCARRARRLPADHPALLHRVRDPADGRGVRARRSADVLDRLKDAGPAHAARRRRRDPLRARAQADRAQEGRARRVARRAPRGAPPRLPVDRHHDVRPRRDADDILDHLDSIRALQDEHGGFTAFVPWSFKPGNTLLEKWIKQYQGPNAYLRMLAGLAPLPRQLPPRPGVVVLRGQEDRPDRAPLRRRRLRRHAVRGERAQGGRLRRTRSRSTRS